MIAILIAFLIVCMCITFIIPLRQNAHRIEAHTIAEIKPYDLDECECGHKYREHSHILVDAPCLDCDCFMFTKTERKTTYGSDIYFSAPNKPVPSLPHGLWQILPRPRSSSAEVIRAQLRATGALTRAMMGRPATADEWDDGETIQ